MTVVAVRVSTQNRHSTFILIYFITQIQITEMLYEYKLKSILLNVKETLMTDIQIEMKIRKLYLHPNFDLTNDYYLISY